MTAKEYLSQAYMIDRRININLKKLEQMRMSLYGKGVCYESDGSKKEHNGNGTEAADMSDKLKALQNYLGGKNYGKNN